jgi:ATP-binding cassette subfamily B protein
MSSAPSFLPPPPPIDRGLWPLARREELLARLAGAAGIASAGAAERFELAYADVTPTFSPRARASFPAALRVGAGELLGVLAVRGAEARLVAPDGAVIACDAAALAAWLRAPAEADARPGLAAAVAGAGITAARAGAVTDALCAAALGGARIAEGARVTRARPSLGAALAAGGAGRRLALAIGGYVAQLGLLAALWWVAGARAVAAGGARGVAPVVALVAALAAARLASSWTAGRLAVDVGEVLRGRLLEGVLALDTEAIRARGIGQLLGRVVETEALESLALGGGLVAAAGLFELATGAIVLAFGVASGAELSLLAIWVGVALLLAARAQRALARWTALRIALTHDLVERMAGQRTLVAQQPPELRHVEEEAALARYADAGRALDRTLALLAGLVPRGWLVAAVGLLAPALAAAAARPAAFAVTLGGVLFVHGALRKLTQAFPALGAAAIAWAEVGDMLAVRARDAAPAGSEVETAAAAEPDGALVVARDLGFRYPGRPAPVLAGCSFVIRRGERVLLEGASGSGKSTLGALLAGLRVPDTGSLALAGVDQRALGAARWRTRVGAAPQLHENHVFSHTLLFNVLLGRAWPPRREDVALAEAVLRELDLGPLLERMPSGLEQLVGESGWQLSHGERSRLFIARALLQPLEARVLDESFAALDPETLERALACVLARAETVIVIAHP